MASHYIIDHNELRWHVMNLWFFQYLPMIMRLNLKVPRYLGISCCYYCAKNFRISSFRIPLGFFFPFHRKKEDKWLIPESDILTDFALWWIDSWSLKFYLCLVDFIGRDQWLKLLWLKMMAKLQVKVDCGISMVKVQGCHISCALALEILQFIT